LQFFKTVNQAFQRPINVGHLFNGKNKIFDNAQGDSSLENSALAILFCKVSEVTIQFDVRRTAVYDWPSAVTCDPTCPTGVQAIHHV
jgi:hypothetical protein